LIDSIADAISDDRDWQIPQMLGNWVLSEKDKASLGISEAYEEQYLWTFLNIDLKTAQESLIEKLEAALEEFKQR